MITDPEDEAWAEIERMQSLNRKRQIEALVPKTQEDFYNELRNQVIQEVADWVHTMPAFGQDTLDSFHIRIMGMKR